MTAQYVALRWEPDFNPPAFVVGGADLIGSPIEIDEKNFGGGPVGSSSGVDGDSGSEVNGGQMPGAGFNGPFAPNSLGGAGAGGLPVTSGGGGGGAPGGGGGGGGIPPVSPR